MELMLKGICKSFGGGMVLDGVDLHIRGGEIHALLGENGAGNSTLMNVAGGVLPADAGEILLDGRRVSFASPADSLAAGIAFIHQELNLVNDLTVYENVFLSDLPSRGPWLDRRRMIAETRELFERLGMELDPCTMVSELDASYKQLVEIARALRADASIIIMDEPTASLTTAEIRRVFAIMRTLKERGIGMVFISHKLDEVTEICDRFTVLRNGTVVKSGSVCDVTAREIAAHMVGHEVDVSAAHCPAEQGEEILRLSGLSDDKHFSDISLSLRRGEVLGVTGLLGNGHSELFATVFGLCGSRYTGEIRLDGEEIHPSASHEALVRGLAYLPKNRKENAIIPDASILDNGTVTVLSRFSRLGFLDQAARRLAFRRQAEAMRIRMSDEQKRITTLSGGNQQKVVLAKWLLSDPKVLILDNPTQGVDVGAKEEIYSIIESLARSGIGVIVLSSEAQEILRVCDRVLVMYRGRVAGELTGDAMNENDIMVLATGAGKGA